MRHTPLHTEVIKKVLMGTVPRGVTPPTAWKKNRKEKEKKELVWELVTL